jgi:Transglutaminase-like superfamily
MFRHIALCGAAATAVTMVFLPLPATGAYAATSTTTHIVAPSVVKQLENSCWGCLHSALMGARHTTPRQQIRPHKHIQHRARLTHTAHRAQRPTRLAHARQIQRRATSRIRRTALRRPVLLTWGTRVLRGIMTSQSVVRMTAAFSVGHAASLTWNLPRPTSVTLNGYRQTVQAVHFRFTVKPASSTDLMLDGHPVRQFHWNNPPADTVINVVEKLHVTTQSSLSPFVSRAAYPLTQVSPDARPYLGITPLVQLPTAARHLVRVLAHGKLREQRVVESVANWVASNVHFAYGVASPAYSATSVWSSHAATCRGYADLTAGMLRSLGIPTQVVFGLVAGKPIKLGIAGSASTMGWGVGSSTGEMHAWLNVYFPDVGWVPLDPQLEKFFIDTRHVAFETNIDAGASGIGTFTAQAAGAASATGRTLSNGYIAIAPADGISSQVGIQIKDAFHVQFDGSRPDVKHVLLFSR